MKKTKNKVFNGTEVYWKGGNPKKQQYSVNEIRLIKRKLNINFQILTQIYRKMFCV